MRPRRVDANHSEIVQALRQVGAVILDTHTIPGGLDILVGFRGTLMLWELKDGAKSKSRRALTPAESVTIDDFLRQGCPVFVVESVDEALALIGVEVSG